MCLFGHFIPALVLSAIIALGNDMLFNEAYPASISGTLKSNGPLPTPRSDDDLFLLGRPVTLLSMSAAAPSGTIVATASTNLKGIFNFSRLAAGNYVLEVKLPGFSIYRSPVITLTQSELRTSTIVLNPDQNILCEGNITRPDILNLKRDFGAKGDGKSDDYDALVAAAAAISKKRVDQATHKIRLVIPPGTYLLDRYIKFDSSQTAWRDSKTGTIVKRGNLGFHTITYDGANGGCENFEIIGCGATISVKGNFERSGQGHDVSVGGGTKIRQYPDANQIVPFYFKSCKNFSISGLELRGNSNQMVAEVDSDQPDTTIAMEGFNHGLVTSASQNYRLSNLYIHHFDSDGVLLGFHDVKGDPIPIELPDSKPAIKYIYTSDRNAVLSGVKSTNNGRGALTIVQLIGGTIQSSEFSRSGRTGKNPGHGPWHGVDLEPDYAVDQEDVSKLPPAIDNGSQLIVSVADEIARDIRFGWSWIRDNKGPQISGIQAEKIRDVNFDQSWISASIDSQPIAVALALPSAIISNSNIDVAYSNIYPGKSHPLGTQTVLKNNRITYFKGNRYRGLYPPESTHSFIFNSEMPLGIVGPPFIPKRESFKTRLIHVLSTGQSLSIGVQPPNTSPRPGISTVQPYSNLMVDLTGRVVPLVEGIQTFRDPTTPNTESPSSALGNYLTALNPSLQNAVTMHGYGAMDYFHLAKGALTVELPDHTRYFAFEDGITRAKLIHAKALELGKRYVPAAVTVIHGEADSRLNTSIESYAKFLGTWQSDYQSELNKIAQDDPNDLIPDEKVPLFTDQMSSYTAQGFTSPRISLAQWEAARVNPDKIFLVGPKYQYHYTDGLHLNVEGYRLLGEYFGKVIDRVIGLKQDWKPLSPLSATRKGAEIRVRFFVPVPPLVFDTALVKAKRESNLLTYGFEYWNSSSNPEKITKVRITGPDEVAITLASNPGTSAGEVIRYAYTGIPGTRSADHYSGAQQENAPRGNLRDSDAAISPAPGSSRKPLYNWAIHFEQPVTCEEQ